MVKTISSGEVAWKMLSHPEPEELAQFVREANLSTLDAEFIVRDHHRPEIAERESYIMIMVHVPVFDRQTRVTSGAPLYVIVSRNTVWTIHHEELDLCDKLFAEYEKDGEKREEYFSDGEVGLALHIVSKMYGSAFHKIERLSKHINIVEDAVFQGNEKKMVEEIAVLQRDVMDFRKVIRPQLNLFNEVPNHLLVEAQQREQWLRMNGQVKKIWDLLESLFESAKELSFTNASLLQHKENELLRLLTIYSVIIIPALILVDPFFTPGASDAGIIDKLAFGVVMTFLVGILLFIFVRSKEKRLL